MTCALYDYIKSLLYVCRYSMSNIPSSISGNIDKRNICREILLKLIVTLFKLPVKKRRITD